MDFVLHLPADVYELVEQSVPIACVDFIPVRETGHGQTEIGLILRDSPYGRVWCHLGGRIGRGETIRDALLRHANDTLETSLDLPDDPQPQHVYQWFPPESRPAVAGTLAYGEDTRKHTIGLSFLVTMVGEPHPRNEAFEFAWYRPRMLPQPLWPGCEALFARLFVQLPNDRA